MQNHQATLVENTIELIKIRVNCKDTFGIIVGSTLRKKTRLQVIGESPIAKSFILTHDECALSYASEA